MGKAHLKKKDTFLSYKATGDPVITFKNFLQLSIFIAYFSAYIHKHSSNQT